MTGEVSFNADLKAVRRIAAYIVGAPFRSTENSDANRLQIIVRPSDSANDAIDDAEDKPRNEEPEMKDAVPMQIEYAHSDVLPEQPQHPQEQSSSEDEMEESDEEEVESDQDESFIKESDEDTQKVIDWFMEVESEAADVQECLEEESLSRVRNEVRDELAERLSGNELEAAVEREMEAYIENCESTLSDLEEEILKLLDKLECAGVSLPALYKVIEKQAPEGCVTETWKKRAHWAGTEAPEEFSKVLDSAEEDLKQRHPVIMRRGKLVEEGASGYLERKIEMEGTEQDAIEWSVLDKIPQPIKAGGLFGTNKWAAVYMASTPEQAARLGLKLPGANKVEEIADIDQDVGLEALALAEESEFGLTEQQKKNLKRVCEEDDLRRLRKSSPKPAQAKVPAVIKPTSIGKSSIISQADDKLDKHEKVSDTRSQLEDASLCGKRPSSSDFEHYKLSNSEVARNTKLPTGEAVRNMPSCSPSTIDTEGTKLSTSEPVEVVTEEPVIGNISDDANKVALRCSRAKRLREAEVIMISDDDEEEKTLADRGSVVQPDKESSKPVYQSNKIDGNNKKRRLVLHESSDEENARLSEGQPSKRNEDAGTVSDSWDDLRPKWKKYICTVCGRRIGSKDVYPHRSMSVIVCGECNDNLEDMSFTKEEDGSEAQCTWCGEEGDLLCCDNCDKVFCEKCIERNFDAETLNRILEHTEWRCLMCDPSPLRQLSQLLKKAQEEAVFSSASAGESKREFEISQARWRKNIRKVKNDDELNEQTKEKLALEKERRERLEKWYDAAKGKEKLTHPKASENPSREAEEEVHLCVGDCKVLGCVVNIANRDVDEPLVRIPPSISGSLKPHQLSGVRFMWENCIESISKVSSGSKGLGCILAHSMGLGKTLQVIAFIYTVMREVHLGFNTVLIVVPVNVLYNWRYEFFKWKPKEVQPLQVYLLEDASRDNVKRGEFLKEWKLKGGIMIIGYTAFRNLSLGKHVKDRETRDTICECLQNPGPDLLVCDEAHMIKNKKADITQALQLVKTHRRIALTGSPLQNNLMEYYCMVDFVREGFLGAPAEFRNRFQNPIANGQHADSTASDVKKMKYRAHVLHDRLKGFVQRKDMSVLKNELPPKCVWVISVRLSPLQKQLYSKYLSTFPDNRNRSQALFEHYHFLAKIWNHPDLLSVAKEEKDGRCHENDFIVEDEDDDSDENAAGKKRKEEKPREVGDYEWCQEIVNGSEREVIENSGKMVLILKLLSMSSAQGDKMLIFSQSLHTLDLLELFLERTGWNPGKDWYRLDGSTTSAKRQQITDHFNNLDNTQVKCVLISTKAGSLGINLTGANRVIIVDGSWNPTHDLQALFRAWRYGQTKPVYAYRLLAYGTMEEKIYNRQLTKEGIAARVLDAHQVGRHLNADDLEILYTLDDEEDEENTPEAQNGEQEEEMKQQKAKHKTFSAPSDAPPRDDLMAMLLLDYRPRWIAQYHEHEPLLEDLEDEKLSPEDKIQAWETFRRDHETQPSDAHIAINQQPLVQGQCSLLPSTLPPCESTSHARVLSRLRIPNGGTVVCGTCFHRIGWEDITRDPK